MKLLIGLGSRHPARRIAAALVRAYANVRCGQVVFILGQVGAGGLVTTEHRSDAEKQRQPCNGHGWLPRWSCESAVRPLLSLLETSLEDRDGAQLASKLRPLLWERKTQR